ncbi:MAG: hypothetical protein KGZ59_02125 [Chitinophagaceae bacterium]|nr:hypothetical protein [Chitinophagaceae bacterium]
MTKIKNICFVFLLLMIGSCNTKEAFKPAEDALDAVRFFSDAYQQGKQEQAKLYCVNNSNNAAQLDVLFKGYNKLSMYQKKQLASAPIIILNIQNINDSTAKITTSDQDGTSIDTFNVVQKNNIWLVNLSK